MYHIFNALIIEITNTTLEKILFYFELIGNIQSLKSKEYSINIFLI